LRPNRGKGERKSFGGGGYCIKRDKTEREAGGVSARIRISKRK